MPMGIWATWVPVGSVVMLNLAPALGTALGLASGLVVRRWIFALVALLLYWLFVRVPAHCERRSPTRIAGFHCTVHRPTFGVALANPSIWLLGLEFACFNIVLIGLFTYFPTFLAEVRGYSLAQAAFIASLSTLVALGLSAPGRLAFRPHGIASIVRCRSRFWSLR